jgi:hypothetical protein
MLRAHGAPFDESRNSSGRIGFRFIMSRVGRIQPELWGFYPSVDNGPLAGKGHCTLSVLLASSFALILAATLCGP